MGGIGDFLFGKEAEQSSSSSSTSGNNAWPFLSGALAPAVGGLNSGMSMLGSLLGLNNPASGTPGTPTPPTPTPPAPLPWEAENRRPRMSEKPGLQMMRRQQQQQNQIPVATELPSYSPVDQTTALQNFADSTGMSFLRDQGVKAIENSAAGRRMLQSGGTGEALMQFGQNLGNTFTQQFMDKLLEFSRLGLGAANTMAGAGAYSTSRGTSSGSGGKTGLIPLAVSAAAASAASGGGG